MMVLILRKMRVRYFMGIALLLMFMSVLFVTTTVLWREDRSLVARVPNRIAEYSRRAYKSVNGFFDIPDEHTSTTVYTLNASYHPPHQSTESCQRLNSVALVKTFKTGGSTLAVILSRYGYERNLSFVLPRTKMFLSFTPFNPKTAILLTQPSAEGFHILNNHAIFNKSGFQQVMRADAKYITILRNPFKSFCSFVMYFHVLKGFNITGNFTSPSFPLQNFLDFLSTNNRFQSNLLHNGQLFSLGFDSYKQSRDANAVANKIRELDLELDLVLINEYYDESLIILKKLMCWKFEDILYVSMKVLGREYRHILPEGHIALIKNWTSADNALYTHFNRTLWTKIEAYGPTFSNDLAYFRSLNKNVNKICSRRPIAVDGEDPLPKLVLHQGQWSNVCKNMKRTVYPYTKLIRKEYLERIAGSIPM